MSKVVWSNTYECAVVGVDENGAPLTASDTPADGEYPPFYLFSRGRDPAAMAAHVMPEAKGWRWCRVTIEVMGPEGSENPEKT